MEEVEESYTTYTALRESLAAALDKPFTRVDLRSLLPDWERLDDRGARLNGHCGP